MSPTVPIKFFTAALFVFFKFSFKTVFCLKKKKRPCFCFLGVLGVLFCFVLQSPGQFYRMSLNLALSDCFHKFQFRLNYFGKILQTWWCACPFLGMIFKFLTGDIHLSEEKILKSLKGEVPWPRSYLLLSWWTQTNFGFCFPLCLCSSSAFCFLKNGPPPPPIVCAFFFFGQHSAKKNQNAFFPLIIFAHNSVFSNKAWTAIVCHKLLCIQSFLFSR